MKNLSVRIDEELLDKLHVVADYEGRSANGQVLVLIRHCIEEYEAKHGEITGALWSKNRRRSDREPQKR